MPTIKAGGLKTVTIKHPSGRELRVREIKAGTSFTIDPRSGKIAPPPKAKRKRA
jgi:hypothetical protein